MLDVYQIGFCIHKWSISIAVCVCVRVGKSERKGKRETICYKIVKKTTTMKTTATATTATMTTTTETATE